MKLTSANVTLPEGKRDHVVFDDVLKGFGLRIRRLSGGRIGKAWIVQYRQHGHGRRMIVGDAEKITAAQARERARKLLAQVELGGDPQGDKKERREKDSHSLRGVISEFLAHKSGKENTLRAARLYLEGDAYLGSLRSLPVDRITRRDLSSRILAVSKANGVPTALGFRAQVSALFTWAMQAGLVEHNPLVGAVKPSRPEARDRVLSDSELGLIWRNLDGDEYGKVVKLLVCTACRREEIGAMHWSEFGDDGSTWTLPKERSKNGRPHTLPITDLMQDIIDTVPQREGNDLLFGERGKRGFTSFSRGKKALDERLDIPEWRHHDVRRSVASRMGDIGIMPHIIEQILNHQSGHRRGPAGVYNRSVYEREVRAAMALWSDHISSLITGGERKIVAFERAAATP
jgi:integrase